MSKKKKIVVVCAAAIAVVAVVLLLMAYVFDTFGIVTPKYKLKYDKYITLAEYKGIEYEKPAVTVTNDEVDNNIKSKLEGSSQVKTVKTGTVKKGDTINISYEGKINDKTFDGGSSDSFDLTVGQTKMIDGFVEGLIGKKIGSRVKLDLTFPKKYHDNSVAGKDVVFSVVINSKKITRKSKLNEDFIKKDSDNKCSTLKEYKEYIKKNLEKNKVAQEKNATMDRMWQQISDKTKVKKYPEKQMAYERERMKKQYKKMAKSYNMKWKDFLKTYMNTTEKEFNKNIKDATKVVVKQKLIMFAIAEKENIKLSDSDYNKELEKMLKQAGFTKKTFEQQYNQTIEEYGEDNDLRTSLLLAKVRDKIYKYGKEKQAKK